MIVFYSWQSWLSTNTNRNFIETAINKARKKVVKEEHFRKLDVLLEKDTENVTGSPDIADTIFEKIRECDVFIGDVTPVATDKDGNKIPNPNVLIELGYAVSELGWERIICVLNTAFGNLENLPFDIRKNRITTYYLTEDMNEEARSNQQKNLSSAIATSLKIIESRFLPDADYLNSLIVKQVYPIRIGAPIIFCFFDLIDKDSEEEELFVFTLLQRLVEDARQAAKQALPRLLVESSHAFTSRQRKRCREIAEVTSEIGSKVGFYLMLWDMHQKQSQAYHTEMHHPRREYISHAITLLKILYESKWLRSFDNLDDKYVLSPDDYLFGKKPLSKEREQEIQDKLYELEGYRFNSREEFDTAFASVPNEEVDISKASAFISIQSAYKDQELANLVWEFIQLHKSL